jgi:type VI secretion system protein ImpC
VAERMTMTFDLGKPGQSISASGQKPHTIVIIGDFRGSGFPQKLRSVGKPQRVEIETLDAVMAKLQPSIPCPWTTDAASPVLSFERIERFHPDLLIDELPSPDNGTEDTGTDTGTTPTAPQQTVSQANPTNTEESDQQTLSRLLGNQPLGLSKGGQSTSTGGVSGKTRKQQTLIDSVVQKLTEQATTDNVPKRHNTPTESTPQIAGSALRGLLHNPAFQQLESHWRSLDWWLRNNPFDTQCPVYLLDIPPLTVDNTSLNSDQCSKVLDALHQQLIPLNSSENQLILIFDDWFRPVSQDIVLLEQLAQIAQHLGALMIAAADGSFANIEEDTQTRQSWHAFRQQDTAGYIMLTLPGLLMRLPYGSRYEPIEHGNFEEWTGPECRSNLLWGNPAYAVSLVLLCERMEDRTFQERRIDDWLSFAYQQDDEPLLQPATESLYSEQDLQQLLSIGLVPALGSRRQNSVRFPWLQTLKSG